MARGGHIHFGFGVGDKPKHAGLSGTCLQHEGLGHAEEMGNGNVGGNKWGGIRRERGGGGTGNAEDKTRPLPRLFSHTDPRHRSTPVALS